MAIGLKRFTFRPKLAKPASRLVVRTASRQPVWPLVSIVVLLLLPVLFPSSFLTALNGLLILLSAAVLLAQRKPIEPVLVKTVTPLLLIVIVGLLSVETASTYNYLKDAWYVVNPTLALVVGFVLFRLRPDLGAGLTAIVIAGAIVGLFQLRPYMADPSLVLLQAQSIRGYVGTGSYTPVLAVTILLMYFGRWRSILKMPAWLSGVAGVICALAVIGAFSRSGLLAIMIAVLALAGCFAKREWLRLGLPLAAIVGVLFAMQLFIDVESDQATKTFSGKVARSIDEVTVENYNDLRDINLRYRGFETARALDQYSAGSLGQLLLGRGFGATVDLGVYLPIEFDVSGNRVNVRQIAWFHNGYMFLLTKGGAVAIFLFISFLLLLYVAGRRQSVGPWGDLQNRSGRLMSAVAMTLAATTYGTGGVFNKGDMFPFLLLAGYLLAAFTPPRARNRTFYGPGSIPQATVDDQRRVLL